MTKFKQVVGTYQKSEENTSYIMKNLFLALIPLIVFSFYKNGLQPYFNNDASFGEMILPLRLILVAMISSIFAELLYAQFILKVTDLKKFLKNSYAGFPGLFLALTLPLYTPILIVVVGSFIASIIGKMIFGGFGQNIFNPALIGRLFIFSAYSINIISNGGYLNASEIDAISSATPLSNFASSTGEWSYDALVAPYGNLFDFFLGTIPGSLGETSAFIILLGFAFLVYKKMIKFLIPVLYITTVFIMTFIIGAFHGQGIWFPLFQILSGGLFFGAIYMATDPVTSPITKKAHILYGIFLGVLTVTFRFLTPEPEGVLTSILTMNMFVFIVDKIGVKSNFDFKKYIAPISVALLSVILIPIYIGVSTTRDYDDVDPNFTIINREKIDDEVIYEVAQKGYVGNIIAKIAILNGEMTNFEILTQNESFWHIINDADYVTMLSSDYSNIENVDTVSNATVTSQALRNLIINTFRDYENGDFTSVTGEIEKDYNIISKEENASGTIYEISKRGFVADILVRLTVLEGVVSEYEVLSHQESYYEDIINANYIDYLVSNQELKEDLDTVSGATVTSDVLKDILLIALEDYNNG